MRRQGDILAGNRRFVVWGRSVWWRTYRPGGFDGYRTLTGRRLPCHTLEWAVCHQEAGGAVVIRRTHTGCGIRNPVAPWTGAALALAYAIFWPAFLLAHTWLAFLGYLPWAVTMAALIRWECVHSPAKVYRTWWP